MPQQYHMPYKTAYWFEWHVLKQGPNLRPAGRQSNWKLRLGNRNFQASCDWSWSLSILHPKTFLHCSSSKMKVPFPSNYPLNTFLQGYVSKINDESRYIFPWHCVAIYINYWPSAKVLLVHCINMCFKFWYAIIHWLKCQLWARELGMKKEWRNLFKVLWGYLNW